jgi:hypothetical protein
MHFFVEILMVLSNNYGDIYKNGLERNDERFYQL